MRKIYCLFMALFAFSSLCAQTAGDIAFIQYNADFADNVAFVTLNEIPANTPIRFTDNGWQSSGSFRATEGTVEWVHTEILHPGTIVTIDFANNSSTVVHSNGVTQTATVTGISGTINFAGTGDQVFAYTGPDASPNFLAGLNNDGGSWAANATSSNNSALPAALAGNLAVDLNPEVDNAAYNGVVTEGSDDDIRNAIADPNNWNTSNSTQQSYTGNIFLPVEFTFFEANKRAETTQLLWQTAKEVNNSHFEVQRADQNMRFSTIGKVEGFGNSEQLIDYDFIDEEPMIGANYYRLKQVDLDGNYDFSEVVSVSFANTDEIRVFPTVASTNFTVVADLNAEIAVNVIDALGRSVIQTTIESNSQVDVSSLPNGIYYVQVGGNGFAKTFKITKQ